MALQLLLLLKLLELLLGQRLLDYLLAIVASLAIRRTCLALEVEDEALLPGLDILVLGTTLDQLFWTANRYLLLKSLKLRQSRSLIRRLLPDQLLLGHDLSQFDFRLV